MKKRLTFIAFSLMATICYCQTIEKYSIDSGGATATAGNIQVLYTIGEVAVQETTVGNVSISEGFIGRFFSTGRLIISEIMKNPAAVDDTNGEYFEVYNAELFPVNLYGWSISDGAGDLHKITTDLIIDADDFIVLGNNSNMATNGDVLVDYQYTGVNLTNGSDAIVLSDGITTEIDRVEYDNGTLWPNPDGAAMLYIGSNIEDNNDGTLWETATLSENISPDFGSPGLNGERQIVDWLVYDNNAWNRAPSLDTGLKNALIRPSEMISFASDINVLSLVVKEDADVNLLGAVTLTIPRVILESTSTAFASLISDGIVTGTVNYLRHVNQTATSGGNDLITPPVSGQIFTDFIVNNNNLVSNSDSSLYLFGPFDKTSGSYLTYANTESAALTAGIGYRAATTDNATLNFEGTINQGVVNQSVFNSGPSYNEWNLIGNPYPSYLNVQDFLSNINNMSVLDVNNVGIYGYDGDASDGWVIYNLNTTDANTVITPGQGFFVAVESNAMLEFTPSMRRHGNADDFIFGRNTNINQHLRLQLSNSNQIYNTDFYFNDNSTHSLDLGYDATVFGGTAGSFAMYSHLVDDNQGLDFAIQSLPIAFLSQGIVPLGVNVNQGEQLTIEIETLSLQEGVNVYLEDNLANTFTLLNTESYVFTPNADLYGTGRFYIHFSNSTLSIPETESNILEIYVSKASDEIVIKGQLKESTQAILYDINGRKILDKRLDITHNYNAINVASLERGVYILQVSSSNHSQTRKVILN